MPGTIITVAQQKGGAGKTTLAAHLAVAFRQMGRSVATVDIDPQASLSQWHEARVAALGRADITHSRITGWRTANEVEKLVRGHDIVLIDSPPHAQTEARIAVRAARLVLVPVQPSPIDFWATQPTLDLVKEEKGAALLVLNRVPSRSKMADELVARIRELTADLAEAQIGNRVSFAAALLAGRSVTEAARPGPAAKEIRALAEEVLRRLR